MKLNTKAPLWVYLFDIGRQPSSSCTVSPRKGTSDLEILSEEPHVSVFTVILRQKKRQLTSLKSKCRVHGETRAFKEMLLTSNFCKSELVANLNFFVTIPFSPCALAEMKHKAFTMAKSLTLQAKWWSYLYTEGIYRPSRRDRGKICFQCTNIQPIIIS